MSSVTVTVALALASFRIGHGDRHGMGTRGIEPDCLRGGGAPAGPAVAPTTAIIAGSGASNTALTRLDAEGFWRRAATGAWFAGEGVTV